MHVKLAPMVDYLRRSGVVVLGCVVVALCATCQDYPFEPREPKRVHAVRIKELVKTINPADILFVIDNSGTMSDELEELRRNVELFVTELVKSDNDFQVGIITTDVDCNVPTRRCPSGPGKSTRQCCVGNPEPCVQADTNGDGAIESNCDGGRLRAADGVTRILKRPQRVEEQTAWLEQFNDAVSQLGCTGSSYESGLEAARRAVVCAVAGSNPSVLPEGVTCPDEDVAKLNAGFIRDNADLVLIFLTDEDDCSIQDPNAYFRPMSNSDVTEQRLHLCSPADCYAYYSPVRQNGVRDWLAEGYIRCVPGEGLTTAARTVMPPDLTAVDNILADIVAVKGGDITRVRAAGIISSMPDDTKPLGFRSAACYKTPAGPLATCGCLSTSTTDPTGLSDVYCQLTGSLDQLDVPQPTNTAKALCGDTQASGIGGCEAMPTNRYVQFLEILASRRVDLGARPDTLVDSICRPSYSNTMFNIVNTVILSTCFELASPPACAENIRVFHKSGGKESVLPNVPVGSEDKGWSWVPGTTQICLEGGLRKSIDDIFEIMVVESQAGTDDSCPTSDDS